MDMEQLSFLFSHFGVDKGFLIWALFMLWRENKRAHQALMLEKERFCREKEGLVLTLQARSAHLANSLITSSTARLDSKKNSTLDLFGLGFTHGLTVKCCSVQEEATMKRTYPTLYLGNINTKEVHDLQAEQSSCHINQIIQAGHDRSFSTLRAAKQAGYDNCAWCLGGSTR